MAGDELWFMVERGARALLRMERGARALLRVERGARALLRVVMGALCCGAIAAFGACEVGLDEPALGRAGGARAVELIGISGRRLGDGDVYRVPLDTAREVEVGARVREAMVLRNGTAEAVAITLMTVTEAPQTARVWAVLEPTRAREVPWEGTAEVVPGGQLDFDVRFEPREVGVSEAWLVVGIDTGRWGERELRWIRLEGTARTRDAPGGTGSR